MTKCNTVTRARILSFSLIEHPFHGLELLQIAFKYHVTRTCCLKSFMSSSEEQFLKYFAIEEDNGIVLKQLFLSVSPLLLGDCIVFLFKEPLRIPISCCGT